MPWSWCLFTATEIQRHMCTSTHVHIATNMSIHLYTIALHIRLKLLLETMVITTQIVAGLSDWTGTCGHLRKTRKLEIVD